MLLGTLVFCAVLVCAAEAARIYLLREQPEPWLGPLVDVGED